MILSALYAISENNVIGRENDLPWHLPADLKYFKKTTLHHPIIMGRKSYESIGRPLPKRINIVVTRNPDFYEEGVLTVHSVKEAFSLAESTGSEEAFIIGGANLYASSLEFCQRIYMTLIHAEVEGDTFMPDPDPLQWQLVSESKHRADEKNIYDYTFRVYERI